MKVIPIILITAVLVSAGGAGAYIAIDMQGHDYSITYVLDGGINGDNPDKYNSKIDLTLKDASKEGNTFSGWYLDSGFTERIEVLHDRGNVTLYAKWTVNKYPLTIHYVFEDETKAADDHESDIDFGTYYSVDSPTIQYFTPSNKTVSGTMTSGGVEKTVAYSADVGIVTYILDGGINGDNPDSITILDGEIELKDPSKEYYDFGGWYLDSEFSEEVISIEYSGSDITLYAKWSAISDPITYVLDGGINSPNNPASFTVETPVTLEDPSKIGYTFEGWFADIEYSQQITVLHFEDGIRTIYAKWTVNNYPLIIHYVFEDGEKAADDHESDIDFDTEYSVDSPAIQYFTPDKTTVSGTMTVDGVEETVTYTADVGIVTYLLDGGVNGDNPDSITILDGTIELKDASKEHHTFGGWYLDDGFSEKVTSIEYSGSDITLYAKWDPILYTITYVLNGGTNSPDNPESFMSGTEVILNAPTKDGYDFAIWIDENDDEITKISEEKDVTVTALWVKDIADTIVAYNVTGKYTNVWIFPFEYNVAGIIEYTYLDYDPDRGYHYYCQEYYNIGGSASYYSETGWTGFPSYQAVYTGLENISTAYGNKNCFVMDVDYGNGSSDVQYYGCDDGILYLVESITTGSGYRYDLDYDLNGISDIDRDDTFTVTVYDGVGITTSGGGEKKVYSEVTCTAVTNGSTSFKGWYDSDGNLLSESASYYIEILTSDITIYALNDEGYDLFTASPDIDLSISDITGIAGLHDISWTLYDDGTAISGDTDFVIVSVTSVGFKTLEYTGTDSAGAERYGIILIQFDCLTAVTYEWVYGLDTYEYTLEILESDYCYYVDLEVYRYHTTYTADIAFVTYNDKYIAELAEYFESLQTANSWTDLQLSQCVLNFTQYIPYEYDSDSKGVDEYWRFPLETLYDGCGDCEDTAILYCAIMRCMGYDSALLLFSDHMASGLDVDGATGSYFETGGVKYFYCETTDTGWTIGERPEGYDSAYVMPVV